MNDKPTPIPPKDTPKTTAKDDGKRAISEHLQANYPGAHPELWKHASAAALHGWGQHEHHMAVEKRLSDEDYQKAIEAALKPVKGSYKPHAAALFVLKIKA